MIKNAGKLVSNIVKPLFEKKGFVDAKIIANWRAIAGEDLYQKCAPVKVSFQQNQRRNGVLYLSVPTPAFSLEIQSSQQKLLTKIHTFFGYEAVSKIRITIKNKKSKRIEDRPKIHKPKLKAVIQGQLEQISDKIENEEIKSALLRLKKSMFS